VQSGRRREDAALVPTHQFGERVIVALERSGDERFIGSGRRLGHRRRFTVRGGQ
jgi:hypothetical protein